MLARDVLFRDEEVALPATLKETYGCLIEVHTESSFLGWDVASPEICPLPRCERLSWNNAIVSVVQKKL